MSNPLVDFYRCPAGLVELLLPDGLLPQPGYFTFGSSATCYGQSTFSSLPTLNGTSLPDLSRHVSLEGTALRIPFDASAIIDNLRLERYPTIPDNGISRFSSGDAIRRLYYTLRPMLSDSLRQSLQRTYFRNWRTLPFPRWPVDTSVEHLLETLLRLSMKARQVEKIPFIWFWPDGARCSAIMTHDVETRVGLAHVPHLMDVDDSFGIKSSFQLVPRERYPISQELLRSIRDRGCEINIHGLTHDGDLFRERKAFSRQARLINRYAQDFGAHGFRSACMYRNVAWYDELQIRYDMSVPNVAHLEPQRGGCCSVFPYFIGELLELPLTTIQDYSLFHILGDYSIEQWKQQIKMIMDHHGLISFIVHPDYVFAQQALPVYKELLAYLTALRQQKSIWTARPGDVNHWWRDRSSMRLIPHGRGWRIEGRGRERARIAYACITGDEVVYTVGQSYEDPHSDVEETLATTPLPGWHY